MIATVARLLAAGLLVVHGLAHWSIPTLWGTRSEPSSWVLATQAEAIGTSLWIATLLVLITAGVLLAMRRPLWRAATIFGGLLSLTTLVLFWDGVYAYGLLIDVGLVAGLIVPATRQGLARFLHVSATEGAPG